MDRAQVLRSVGKHIRLDQTLPDQIDDEYFEMYFDGTSKNAFFRQSGKPFTIGELRRFCREGIEHQNVFYYSIRDLKLGSLIGSVRIGPIDFNNSLSDLVTLIGSRANRGKGFGTEAIRIGTRIAFERHGIRKLHGGILAANTASLIAYTRAGWCIEGTLRQHHLIRGEPMDWMLVSCFNPSRPNGDGRPAAPSI